MKRQYLESMKQSGIADVGSQAQRP